MVVCQRWWIKQMRKPSLLEDGINIRCRIDVGAAQDQSIVVFTYSLIYVMLSSQCHIMEYYLLKDKLKDPPAICTAQAMLNLCRSSHTDWPRTTYCTINVQPRRQSSSGNIIHFHDALPLWPKSHLWIWCQITQRKSQSCCWILGAKKLLVLTWFMHFMPAQHCLSRVRFPCWFTHALTVIEQ